MKIIYRAENIIDANLVKGTLALEGIPSFVSGEFLTGGIGQLPAGNLVTVMVADSDVGPARAIAQSIDAALRENHERDDGAIAESAPA